MGFYTVSCSPLLALPSFLLLAVSTLSSIAHGQLPALPLPSQVIHQFPSVTWVENLAFRFNGQILVTLISSPDVYLIDTLKPQPTVQLVHTFPSVLAVFGIAQLGLDQFYVAAGNTSISPFSTAPRSFSVWEIDMRLFLLSGASVRKVVDIPEAGLLNGAVALSVIDNTILIADSGLGVVWKVNVQTGVYSIAISDPTMTPSPNATLQVGINGVKIRNNRLYFTNTNQGLLCSVAISQSGTATGVVQVLATGLQPDDFDLDGKGRAWIAQRTKNVVSVLLANGTVVDVVGAVGQLTVAGVDSCIFGALNIGVLSQLYCSTNGGYLQPVNGTIIEGGKVVVIQTLGF